ncbi:hypothetical protein Trco_008483 [Trichoderma cornu-damae]|uniref:Zn(2)-C6 fungal-type domain-containing protein n=1 Tax=Trichoderma cornu-damae TaxID=654480 RepID=A0A9P8QIR5_9HYPO|nr:hypothetical protein Trco_008483 [Trichoderma cornu-damae]
MTDGDATKNDIAVRKRKAHRKSRLGCGNCKIRSVKCDESKPSCRRCQASGFTCNYSSNAPTLELSHSSVLRLSLPRGRTGAAGVLATGSLFREASLRPAFHIPIVLPLQGRLGDYTLRLGDYAALDRFQKRTAGTLGTVSSRRWYFQVVSGLAKQHPFLFHFFLALTLLHDTDLSQNPLPSSHDSSLAFHLYHGSAILHYLLALPSPTTTLSSSHRDALWICASILGAASFASVPTPDARAAWPLAGPDPIIDLDWLKMSHSKRAVWEIADPARPESVFHGLIENTPMHRNVDTSPPIPPDVLPPLFYSLFNLSQPSSSVDTNPYHSPCSILSTLSILWNGRIDDHNATFFLSFITQMDPHYRSLIEKKDPRALLLLLHWHSMVVPHKRWWVRRRCAVEGNAICMYLEKYCAEDDDIMALLQVPKERLAKGY